MTQKQILAITIAFLFAIQTKAQNNIPQTNIPQKTILEPQSTTVHIFKVGSVTLSVDSAVHVTTGAGATKSYFKAVINSLGTGTIHYQWVLTTQANTPNNQPSIVQGTLQVSGSGANMIFTERDHVNHNSLKTVKLEIISPNSLTSNQITF